MKEDCVKLDKSLIELYYSIALRIGKTRLSPKWCWMRCGHSCEMTCPPDWDVILEKEVPEMNNGSWVLERMLNRALCQLLSA